MSEVEDVSSAPVCVVGYLVQLVLELMVGWLYKRGD